LYFFWNLCIASNGPYIIKGIEMAAVRSKPGNTRITGCWLLLSNMELERRKGMGGSFNIGRTERQNDWRRKERHP